MTERLFPQFAAINVANFAQDLEKILKANVQHIEELLQQGPPFTWTNLIEPLDDMEDFLEKFWSPLAHLHAVCNSPALRDCYQACLPMLSAYETQIGHHHGLYEAVQSIDKKDLNAVQLKILDDIARNFKLAGIALPAEDKQRFEAISTRLSILSNQFENNILDASQAFELPITDKQRLQGLPEHALHTARATAEQKGLEGYLLNLEFPCYLAVMSYADDRSLRETFHQAYVTRASDQGPFAYTYDNSLVMDEMLSLRYELAQMLGYSNYAALSLATKMADSTDAVLDFLDDLCVRSRQQALDEVDELNRFAKEAYAIEHIEPWDIAYLSEKQKHARYSITEEELRPYFPLTHVMQGLFYIVSQLYGMVVEEVTHLETWHQDVLCYCIKDEQGQVRGYIYADLFARKNKRNGAWMDSLQSRRKSVQGKVQLPIATLTCNFAKASGKRPPILSHDEVLTLFHEFGHCLHHVLTQVDYLEVSGIHGVEWDAVELPSQFFENFCWDVQALQKLSAHVDNGAPLPASLIDQMLAAKNYQSAMAMMRQLELSLFDVRIHLDYQKETKEFIAATLAKVRTVTQVLPVASYNRFQHSFSHIFAGGYAAGYYSYKWAEVLSSDAFLRFEEEGIFNAKTGRSFLHEILEQGGARKAAESFMHFRGRAATIDALLKHNGIKA